MTKIGEKVARRCYEVSVEKIEKEDSNAIDEECRKIEIADVANPQLYLDAFIDDYGIIHFSDCLNTDNDDKTKEVEADA